MERINYITEFECLGNVYAFKVVLLIDDLGGNLLRFHFSSEDTRLPERAKDFDVVTTYQRRILFNRLAQSDDELIEAIRICVVEYVANLKDPRIPLGTSQDD